MPQDRSLTQRDLPLWLPAAIAVLVIGLLIALIGGVDIWPGGGDDETSTSTTSSTTTSTTSTTVPPDPIDAAALSVESTFTDPATSYRVTYDVVEADTATTLDVTVRRPYESIDVSRNEAGEITVADATSKTYLYRYLAGQGGWLPVQAERHRAEADIRPLAGLATMIELGLVSEQGTGTYAGRDCTVYLTGTSITQTVTAPSEDETNEVCIDANGIVLYERWQQAGSVLLERTATAVEIEPAVDDAVFDPTPLMENADDFTGQLATGAASTPEELAGLATDIVAPEGYSPDGAVTRAGAGSSHVVRFYTDGVNLIEHLEQDGVTDENMGQGGAYPVVIEGVGDAWFVPGFISSTLRMRVGETRMVEVTGPYPADLVQVIRSLTLR